MLVAKRKLDELNSLSVKLFAALSPPSLYLFPAGRHLGLEELHFLAVDLRF